MEKTDMTLSEEGRWKYVADPLPFARSYQMEALEKALKQNTIVFFETGTGKTLIAIMLLRSYACFLRKPSPYIAVFLVPTVVLVGQQSEVVTTLTDLKVGKYYGELGVDFWDANTWKQEKEQHEVLVMTPQIFLNALRHSFLRIDQIKVLIFDECHNARGKHPYACIMTEFYHCDFKPNSVDIPRVFGMTASPIKAKALHSEAGYWKQIKELEDLMDAKVFTCDSDSVLAQYVPFSTPKVKIYNHMDIPESMFKPVMDDLIKLTRKVTDYLDSVGQHELSLSSANISESVRSSAEKRLKRLLSTFEFCVSELGIWLARKAAEVNSRKEEDIFIWGEMDASGEKILRSFSSEAVKVLSVFMPSGLKWSIADNLRAGMRAGYLTSKVICLVETLLAYSQMKDLRCIIFVERIITAIVISSLLNEILSTSTGWRTEYTAGNNSMLKSQSRRKQDAVLEEFRKGTVNIIVSTPMLEEGLDVQSCNLVIRFDPSATVCSFIQSKGRARMENSDFIVMVRSGDSSALSRVKNYVESGDIMRRECLRHADLPCEPLSTEMNSESCYRVESSGAIVTLSSSVSLLYFYCSRLPCDGYFKPYPRFTISKELGNCKLHLPSNCPVQVVTVDGNPKLIKQLACLEACKQLHKVGSLTDNLVPDIVEEEAEAEAEAEAEESGYEAYLDECPKYIPPELVGASGGKSNKTYQCYLIELQTDFQYDINIQDILLVTHAKLDNDFENLSLDLDVRSGKLTMRVRHIEKIQLSSQQVVLCQRFQITLFRVLLDHNLNKLREELDHHSKRKGSMTFNYLLLPSLGSHPNISIDWKCVTAGLYLENFSLDGHKSCLSPNHGANYVHAKNGLLCRCVLENSLVCTPHNGHLYCIVGALEGFDGTTCFKLKDGESVTYEMYYEQKYGIRLKYQLETLLKAKRVFTIQSYLHRSKTPSSKEPTSTTCELPPELCSVVMSPISISIFYSFSFLPSVMHRIESLLLASNLRTMHAKHWKQTANIPILKVLEAITTKRCQEKFNLESLETLGDSFLKYATSRQLFCTHQNQNEGILSVRRSKVISNESLCKLGSAQEITGFIRNEPFDPSTWTVPGSTSSVPILKKQTRSSKTIYVGGSREIKSKTVADVVEALIGAYLSTGDETVALSFMAWLGIGIDFINVPYTRNFVMNPELHINVKFLESLLNYSFRDASLLVEALTHGSYMLPDIPRCYQRLEFLGDAVLDYLITIHLYDKYPSLSPGLLSDLRSASVNNDCYARSAMKVELYKHILHASSELQRQIVKTVGSFDELPSVPTFGWESETTFPKVLGDVIESLAGAILVDSGYNKDTVFQSIKPILEPLITPETLTLHPVRELGEVCLKKHYILKKPEFSHKNGITYATVEVDAGGVMYKETRTGADKKTAKRIACKAVLESLKGNMLNKRKESI